MEMGDDSSSAKYISIWKAYDRFSQYNSRFYRPVAHMDDNENSSYRDAFGIQFYRGEIDIMICNYQRMLSIASKIFEHDESKIAPLLTDELEKLFDYRRNGW